MKSLLSSMPIYFLSLFPLKKWAIEKDGQDKKKLSYRKELRTRVVATA